MQSLHPKPPKHHGNVQFLSIQDCWKQHMFFFAETCYAVHFNNPMMALSKSYKGRDKVFSLTSMNETPATVEPNATASTPATVEPNATASTPATVESYPTASTPTQPSTRSGRKVHLPTSAIIAMGRNRATLSQKRPAGRRLSVTGLNCLTHLNSPEAFIEESISELLQTASKASYIPPT
ncbi:hypothetical protein TNCV_619661 [Trichonephila clavipes]|nr:hypothetical protein TNCV_619661 [Trichonephila clavipes]